MERARLVEASLCAYCAKWAYKAKKTATKLHFHAVKSPTKIDSTKHAFRFSNSGNTEPELEAIGRAGFRRVRRAPGRMADNPPDPH
eukprot:994553-Pelagomonas_calceolata.AAC.1